MEGVEEKLDDSKPGYCKTTAGRKKGQPKTGCG